MTTTMRPTVYLETTIPSYLTARPSRDLRTVARQQITVEWWETRRASFECLVSPIVLREAAKGDALAAAARLDSVAACRVLAISRAMVDFAESLIRAGVVPASVPDDAAHIAIAAMSGVRFLLTWNFKHIANAEKADEIRAFCLRAGYVCPTICTPEELLEAP